MQSFTFHNSKSDLQLPAFPSIDLLLSMSCVFHMELIRQKKRWINGQSIADFDYIRQRRELKAESEKREGKE